ADTERVPGAVAVPPAAAGLNAVGGRDDRERVEHPQLIGGRIQNYGMLGVETPPAREHLVRIAQLRRERRATVLHEERVRSAAEPEIGLVHVHDAIPSRPGTRSCSTGMPG